MERSAPTVVETIKRAGDRLGFDGVRITTPDAIGEAGTQLQTFIAEGRHGDMTWMAEHETRRADPRKLWPEANSIIMCAMSYAPSTDPLAVLDQQNRAAISVYAQGKDYHDVIKTKLRQLAGVVAETTSSEVKVFVDTAPLMEKPLAAAAGLGWQGKHTNLVSRTHGSWLFLGAILTTADLASDPPEIDHCGSCQRCLDVCPTDAFPTPYTLDARRCIAYLTIEHQGHIAPEFRRPIGNRVFGCDDCLAVCPWNKFAETARETRFAARAETDAPPLADLLALDDAAFRKRFAGTPIKRTGRARVVRNALIAAGNSADLSLVAAVIALLNDDDARVRAMAVWALRELVDERAVDALRNTHLPNEPDTNVQREWTTPAETAR